MRCVARAHQSVALERQPLSAYKSLCGISESLVCAGLDEVARAQAVVFFLLRFYPDVVYIRVG